MRRRARVTALLLSICAMAAVSTPVQADDAITDSARRRFQEGVRSFDHGRYEEARAAFLQAYALKRHPAVLLNLAQSELRSGHQVDAARHFAAFLRDSGSSSATERAEAEKCLAQLRSKLGRLTVNVNASGATVLIDGEVVGETPLAEPIDVTTGSHTVEAKSGGRASSSSATVTAGKVAVVSLTLETTVAAAPPITAAEPAPSPSPQPLPPAQPAAAAPNEADRAAEVAESSNNPPPRPEMAMPHHEEESTGFFGWVGESRFAWVTIGLTTAGIAAFAIGGITSMQADANARSVSDQINAAAAKMKLSGDGICNRSAPAPFPEACATWQSNIDARDTDIKVAAVGAVAAGVGLIATVVGYAASPSKKRQQAASVVPVVSPWATPQSAGLGIRGSF